MQEQQIHPHKVTKPIQLLAAWLVGLIIINGLFLGTSIKLEPDSWERGALIAASIINVPVFLFALFTLQTKFRAELQEDTFYSEYLSKKTANVVHLDKNASQDTKIEILERKIFEIATRLPESVSALATPDFRPQLDWAFWPVALNETLSDYRQIRIALREANIPLTEIFGGGLNKPKNRIISLSYSIPASHKAQILRVLLPFSFDGIQLWEPVSEADENEDVYIGSYGATTYAPITDELEEILEGEVEDVDLQHYYQKFRKNTSIANKDTGIN